MAISQKLREDEESIEQYFYFCCTNSREVAKIKGTKACEE